MSKLSRRLRRLNLGMRPKRSVAILTPCGDQVHTEYCVSLSLMLLHTLAQPEINLEKLTVQTYGCSIIPHSRNVLAAAALELGVTHTLWIDADMGFPKDMLLRFLTRDEEIIGINAMMRRPPYLNCAQKTPREPLVTNPESTGLEIVHRTGFGVMWIATDVFRKVGMPLFNLEYQHDTGVFRGEDYFFCESAKKAGYEIYVDHDLSKQIQHLGTFGYNPLLKTILAEGKT